MFVFLWDESETVGWKEFMIYILIDTVKLSKEDTVKSSKKVVPIYTIFHSVYEYPTFLPT